MTSSNKKKSISFPTLDLELATSARWSVMFKENEFMSGVWGATFCVDIANFKGLISSPISNNEITKISWYDERNGISCHLNLWYPILAQTKDAAPSQCVYAHSSIWILLKFVSEFSHVESHIPATEYRHIQDINYHCLDTF